MTRVHGCSGQSEQPLPKPVVHPDSLWRYIRGNGTDGHGNRASLCECRCPERTRRSVRNSDLKSGASMGCGCTRSKQLWEKNKKAIKQPVVVSRASATANANFLQITEKERDIGTASARVKNLPLIGDRYKEALVTPAPADFTDTLVVINPADIGVWYCCHGKPGDNVRLGTSSECYDCRNIKDGADAAKAAEDAARRWAAQLDEDPELSVFRGLAPGGGKNYVTGNMGSAEIEFNDQRYASKRLYGGHQRTAGGRDRIAPWQSPAVDSTEDEGGGLPPRRKRIQKRSRGSSRWYGGSKGRSPNHKSLQQKLDQEIRQRDAENEAIRRFHEQQDLADDAGAQ